MPPTIDDPKLFEHIVAECELGLERLKQIPRDHTFLDSKGAAWNRGSVSPQSAVHRVFYIFNFEGSDDVWIYGVPATDKYPEDAFMRWIIQRKGTPLQTDKGAGVTVSCTISHMNLATFVRQVGDKLWESWVETTKARDTRNAAESMQGALELIVAGEAPLTTSQAIQDFAKATLRDLSLLEEDSAPVVDPPEATAAAPGVS